MNGASGKYDGATVKLVGTTIGFVSKVAGSVLVASTTPGRMLPTGEPTPGKVSAAPNELPLVVGGPSKALNPGNPNIPPGGPALSPKFGPMPPVNGKPTNGWPKV